MAPITHEKRGAHGAASSTHYLGTATAMAVLARGGNAFDAAVAAGFVLQVVEPHLCGPGGEVPIVFVTATDPTPRVLCGQGVAPAAATTGLLRGELGLDIVPGTGLLAATVPGRLGRLAHAAARPRHHDAGRGPRPGAGLRVRRVPARPAHPADDRPGRRALPRALAQLGADLAAGRRDPGRHPPPARARRHLAAAARGCGGSGQRPGRADRRRSRRLVPRVRRGGDRGLLPHAGARRDRSRPRRSAHRGRPGRMVGDLRGRADRRRRWGAGRWRRCGPWSQGPVLVQALQLLRDVELAYVDGVATADTVHRSVEAAKLAFADREAWYGDSAPVPLDELVSPAYAAHRRGLIGESATFVLRPGSPGGRHPVLPPHAVEPGGLPGATSTTDVAMGLGEPTVGPTGATRGDTVHVDVVDAAGNMVSATPSGGWLQSSPTIPALGFGLGSRAQMFWLEDGYSGVAGPREAAAHDAHALAGPARRGADARVRHAGRRPAGPVAALLLARAHRRRPRPPGGDRRTDLAFGVVPVVLRAAGLGPRPAHRRVPPRRRDARRAAAPRARGDRRRPVGPRAAVRGRSRRGRHAARRGGHAHRGGLRGGVLITLVRPPAPR